MTSDDNTNIEPETVSPFGHMMTELQLYGYRPCQDEPDARPLPEAQAISGAVADIFDAIVATLCDTRLEPDLEDLLWSTVNLFHRTTDAFCGNSTPTRWRRGARKPNRMARRSAQSSSNGSRRKA